MDNVNPEIETDKKENNREKREPIWKFSENKIVLNFENFVDFIRMFLAFCIFYMFIWIFRDKNADIRSTGQLFSLYNSAFCSVLSIYYFFTGSVYSALLISASFFSSTIADIYYGYFHYHSIMCKPNGYIHHIVYLLFWTYLIYYDFINIIANFTLCEIATFFINVKQVFRIDSLLIQLSILVSFIVFRDLWWGYLMYKNPDVFKKYIPTAIVSSLSLFLHIQWTITHANKTWKYITKRR